MNSDYICAVSVVLMNLHARKQRMHRMATPQVGDRFGFSFDFMAVDSESRVYQTQFREMVLDSEGWPVVTDNNFIPWSES